LFLQLSGNNLNITCPEYINLKPDRVIIKIRGTDPESGILIHKCKDDKIGLPDMSDFILAFRMIHEVPDQQSLFKQVGFIIVSL